MKAVVYRQKKGLVVEEVAAPAVGSGQALVAIRAVGVCGSDLFFFKNGLMKDGYILGHECAGEIAALGDGMPGWSVGDRVIIRCAGCGKCPACARGEENLCPARRGVGVINYPGAFAEYALADEDMLIRMPEGLDFRLAAMAEPLATALHGIRVSGWRDGAPAMVIGAGPIGLCAVLLLKSMNASPLIVMEPSAERTAMAAAMGADVTLAPGEKGLSARVSAATGGWGVDFIYDCAGVGAAIEQAFQFASRGGRVTTISVTSQPISVFPLLFMQKQLSYHGSFANTQAECRECLELMASGVIEPMSMITDEIGLDELPGKFDALGGEKRMVKVMVVL